MRISKRETWFASWHSFIFFILHNRALFTFLLQKRIVYLLEPPPTIHIYICTIYASNAYPQNLPRERQVAFMQKFNVVQNALMLQVSWLSPYIDLNRNLISHTYCRPSPAIFVSARAAAGKLKGHDRQGQVSSIQQPSPASPPVCRRRTFNIPFPIFNLNRFTTAPERLIHKQPRCWDFGNRVCGGWGWY